MSELLPCPFCGMLNASIKKFYIESQWKYIVSCETIKCGKFWELEEKAIEQWNTRAIPKESEPLKLEVGKVYETRNGRRALCIEGGEPYEILFLKFPNWAISCSYYEDGKPDKIYHPDDDMDLIKLSPNQSREIILWK